MTPNPAMTLALQSNFGGAELWREQFHALRQAHAGAAGRAMLVFQPRDSTLVNQWVAGDSDPGGLSMLALESGPPEADQADLDSIDWAAVYERYQHAVHDASEPFGAEHAEVDGALLLDVRRDAMFELATTTLPGAQWRDPGRVAVWTAALPADRSVVVYCVYGHEVGRATAMRLRAAGLNARFLRGGIDGWQAAGQPLAAKADAS